MTQDKSQTFCSSVKCQCLMFFLTAGCVAVVVCVALLSTSVRSRRPPDMEWWKKTIVYQIYPRSFLDTNEDGVGDLRGIIQKMDYFSYLNVKAIWLSPVHESPMKDFGYDSSNFTNIDTWFGNITDMKELIHKAHNKGIKVIVDFVPGYTSDQHFWFQESEKNISKYADYYVWADGKNGTQTPPNNWLSFFKNSSWTWSDKRQQFYYHAFLKEQPDLNYRNPDVVKEMKEVLRFWLDLGVDGFRVDAIAFLVEEADVSLNEPPSNKSGFDSTQWGSLRHIHTQNKMKEVSEIIHGWRSVLDEFEEKDDKPRFMILEAYTRSVEQRKAWYNTDADMVFNFRMVDKLSPDCGGKCIADMVQDEYENLPKGAWPNFVLGNHDNRRVANRTGPEYVDALNMMLLTLRGTPTTYYGEEIGMEDMEPTFAQSRDPWGLLYGEEDYLKYSRDPERTPMQWNDGYNAGFSNHTSLWLPLGTNYKTNNVQTEKNSSHVSSIQLYRTLAKLREEPAFSYGLIKNVVVNDNIFSYRRHATDFPSYLVVINFGNSTSTDDYSGSPVNVNSGVVVAATGNSNFTVDTKADLKKLKLKPAEGLVIKV